MQSGTPPVTLSPLAKPFQPPKLTMTSLKELKELAELVGSLGLQKIHVMEKPKAVPGNVTSSGPLVDSLTEEEREWEQKRLALELAKVPKVSPTAQNKTSKLSPAKLTKPSPWNYDFSDVVADHEEMKNDLEMKLCLKYRELTELKEDRETAERGILRCRGEIDDLIEKISRLKPSKTKKTP